MTMSGREAVVVGVSGSLASLAALRAGAEQARRGGRVLVAVLAWEPPEGEGLYLRHPDAEWARHWYGEARGRLDRAFDEVFGGPPRGVVSERRVIRGRAGRVLCDVAAHPDALLVIGARPHWRPAPRTHRYVHAHATCAVLTTPAPRLPKGVRRTLRRMTPTDFALAGH
ncbi:universal stress protein [Streptomyces venezuelae]|uniref:Universal stress protein n=1 Tax=Streptomyces venezuelae TaxID=54571 RepID=A0A5P2BIK6_STRVZ|nr:universal stress protein [Streptomyces venezuelae]QES30292.1 universal stress protein [Streptomyces venezuelae]